MRVRMDTSNPEYRWRKAQKSSQESLTRLIDIALENYSYVDLVDAIINDAVRHTKINVNNKVKEITVELAKTTDTKLNEIGKSLMREYSRQLKNSKRIKNQFLLSFYFCLLDINAHTQVYACAFISNVSTYKRKKCGDGQ